MRTLSSLSRMEVTDRFKSSKDIVSYSGENCAYFSSGVYVFDIDACADNAFRILRCEVQ